MFSVHTTVLLPTCFGVLWRHHQGGTIILFTFNAELLYLPDDGVAQTPKRQEVEKSCELRTLLSAHRSCFMKRVAIMVLGLHSFKSVYNFFLYRSLHWYMLLWMPKVYYRVSKRLADNWRSKFVILIRRNVQCGVYLTKYEEEVCM